MIRHILSLLAAVELVSAFPWVARMPGVDSSLLHKGYRVNKRDDASCPNNPDHTGAAPYSDDYPYTGAKNGTPGTQKGGIQVPAPGDAAHQFEAPGDLDIRGPCPGLNTAANHHFLSHDGITTYTELLDAQQNLFNVGYDLATLLAVLGVGLDGDPITQKMSLGCDASSRTSFSGGLTGAEPGLDGHNRFEGDTSLTRNDYFLADGDNFNFNGTLFQMMTESTGGLYSRDNIAKYRKERYDQSLATNPNFYYGPKSLLLYGAASFLYELFPSGGDAGTPDLPTISSFFGAAQDSNGGHTHIPEQIPANWYNRASPYTLMDVGDEILAQYFEYPVLFGGNVGVGNFDALGSFGFISNGMVPNETAAADAVCFLYQLATENVPSSVSGVLDLPAEVVSFAVGKLNPVFENFGCPLVID